MAESVSLESRGTIGFHFQRMTESVFRVTWVHIRKTPEVELVRRTESDPLVMKTQLLKFARYADGWFHLRRIGPIPPP